MTAGTGDNDFTIDVIETESAESVNRSTTRTCGVRYLNPFTDRFSG